MTDTHAPVPPSRESFFALYWDHARDRPRMECCLLAGFASCDLRPITEMDWDRLTEWERVELRRAILSMLPVHDAVRAESQRSRELRGEKVAV